MNTQPLISESLNNPGNKYKNIFIAGLLAGFLDGMAAVVDTLVRYGVGPASVFKFIASGIFGKEAFTGGSSMVLLGVFFHFFIATSWAFLFFMLYPRIKMLRKNKFLVGIVYGMLVWLVMNRIVVPLANTPKTSSFNLWQALKGMSYIILFVGIPISWLANRYYSNKKII